MNNVHVDGETAMGNDKTGRRIVVDCAGQRTAVDQELYTDRCAIGNTDDFLKAFKAYVHAPLIAFGAPAPLNIVIPSYASGSGFLIPLHSLLAQNYDQDVEILVFVNEPFDPPPKERAANDRAVHLLATLTAGALDNAFTMNPHEKDLLKRILKHLRQKKGQVRLAFVRETITGGLATVYQTAIASYLARLRQFCKEASRGDRAQRLVYTRQHLFRTLILFCDDDMEFENTRSLQTAFNYAVDNNAIILGRVHINQVETRPERAALKPLLKNLMQLFLEFKHDAGLNFLAPRGMLLGNALVGGRLKAGRAFADQLYFANLATGRPHYFMKVTTCISESDYAGNGLFLRDLADYLSGEENAAVDIFTNVLHRYQEKNHWARFCADDIIQLVNLLQTRSTRQVSLLARELLSRV